MWNKYIMSVSMNHKIQYSDINDIKKKCKNMIIYYVRVIEFINNFFKQVNILKSEFKDSKNCFNSNENLLKNFKLNINDFIIEIENNNILSNSLFDYKLTKNILSNISNIEEYFLNVKENEIHRYKEKYFLEFIFNRNLNYLHSLPLITINYDEKNLILSLKIFRKFINSNEIKYFELTKLYKYLDEKEYIDIYNHNLEYLDVNLHNPVYDELINYLKSLLNEIEAIYKVIEIII